MSFIDKVYTHEMSILFLELDVSIYSKNLSDISDILNYWHIKS